jgi:hypothetical protein
LIIIIIIIIISSAAAGSVSSPPGRCFELSNQLNRNLTKFKSRRNDHFVSSFFSLQCTKLFRIIV